MPPSREDRGGKGWKRFPAAAGGGAARGSVCQKTRERPAGGGRCAALWSANAGNRGGGGPRVSPGCVQGRGPVAGCRHAIANPLQPTPRAIFIAWSLESANGDTVETVLFDSSGLCKGGAGICQAGAERGPAKRGSRLGKRKPEGSTEAGVRRGARRGGLGREGRSRWRVARTRGGAGRGRGRIRQSGASGALWLPRAQGILSDMLREEPGQAPPAGQGGAQAGPSRARSCCPLPGCAAGGRHSGCHRHVPLRATWSGT